MAAISTEIIIKILSPNNQTLLAVESICGAIESDMLYRISYTIGS
jgi:hypothetical protein